MANTAGDWNGDTAAADAAVIASARSLDGVCVAAGDSAAAELAAATRLVRSDPVDVDGLSVARIPDSTLAPATTPPTSGFDAAALLMISVIDDIVISSSRIIGAQERSPTSLTCLNHGFHCVDLYAHPIIFFIFFFFFFVFFVLFL